MIAFIGLGNIGDEYANTKHNAGFWSIDEFAIRHNMSFKPGQGGFIFSQNKSKKVVLIKPTTNMNKSGIAVKEIMDYWGIAPSEIVVVLDDVDLPLGTVRIRPKGGDGCHKGLENIIYHIRTKEFTRMRLGIAEPLKETRPSEEYVLKPFHKDNHEEVDLMIQQSVDAMEHLLSYGLSQTMNKYNS